VTHTYAPVFFSAWKSSVRSTLHWPSLLPFRKNQAQPAPPIFSWVWPCLTSLRQGQPNLAQPVFSLLY